MKNILVVCNYRAGRKTADLNKKFLRKFLLENFEKISIVDICEVDDIDTSKFDTVIAVGGDGTINKVLPLVINTNKNLGIVPCGTANLLAAKLGISTNIKKALKTLKKGKTKKIDVMSVNNVPCVLRFGLGYDFNIIAKTPQLVKNKFGYFSYFILGILFALRLEPKEYHVIADKNEFDITASCVVVANAANMYRNLVSVGDKCDLADGLMDVFILKARNPISFFFEFLSIIFRRRISNSRAVYFKSASLKLKNKRCMAHIDGEKQKFEGDLNFEILNRAVAVYV